MSEGLDARRAAMRAVATVMAGKSALDAALSNAPEMRTMEARDRAFARQLAATTLRRAGQTEAMVKRFLNRPLPDNATMGRALLLTGAAQMLWLGTPAHAAVSSSVALAKESPATERLAGLVNAVLRRVADAGRARAEKVPVTDNLPYWLRESWTRAYGIARTTAIAEAITRDPPLDVTVKNPAEAERWAEALESKVLPGGHSLRKAGIGDITALPGYEEGAWWAQDAGAALPARLLNAKPGERVLDLCAAPGGKTMQLAATGASVTALDASPKRLKRVEDNLARTGLSAELVAADGRSWRTDTPFDAILLDAPCTSTGTLRRRPDAAFLKSQDDVVSLAAIQDDLAKAAFENLKPGGRMVICTCSLQPEEGELWLKRILAAEGGWVRDPVTPEELTGLREARLPDGSVRLSPDMWDNRNGIDGFFIARLIRKKR
ncbi:MAG TPA: rRNA methyltransferase [Alphaproteobacteria bacterium]|nr:rRNA methyltransferase [Alphaproteobacteria bacterium]